VTQGQGVRYTIYFLGWKSVRKHLKALYIV
jgi:hypothetical protein